MPTFSPGQFLTADSYIWIPADNLRIELLSLQHVLLLSWVELNKLQALVELVEAL
jgi:hypothetical protein